MAILNEIATFNRKIQKVINDENKRNEQMKQDNNKKD